MKSYFIKTPAIFKRIFSSYSWHFNTSKKEIYLTFDDGPTPEVTDFVLNELQKYNAKATFFCIGKNIALHPTIFNRIATERHAIGNHTQHHLNGWKSGNKAYMDSVLECENIISNSIEEFSASKIKNQEPRLFRPPYGKIKPSQGKALKKLGYKIVMWDVLSADFDTSITKETCLQNVLNNTGKGSIIVFHDSLKAKEKVMYTLPKVLEYYSQKGYTFKAI